MTQHDKLTDSERARIRGFLHAFMADHPARAPFVLRTLDSLEMALFQFTFMPLRLAGAGLVVVLCASVGTSYAAEGALPGQALYGVKINVNEKIAGAMAVSPVAKAEFNADLTVRRLEEAEILAAANQLSPEISSDIQTRIETSAANFSESVAAIELTNNGELAAAEVQSDLEATLSAHANVLSALTSVAPETEDVLAPIISTVESHVATARKARSESLSSAVLATSSPSRDDAARSLAAKKKVSAVEALEEIRMLENASTTISLPQRGAEAARALAEGEAYMERGEYDRATDAFDTATRAATQAQVETAVSIELQKILPALPIEAEAISTTSTEINSTTGTVLGTTTPTLNGKADKPASDIPMLSD